MSYSRSFRANPIIDFIRGKLMFFLTISAGYVVMWPTLTSGVDPHHDGLVIVTINATKEALLSGGEPPFNQYGPFWSILYAILSLPFSPSSTLIVARIITLTIYFLTAFYTYRITQCLKVRGLWMLVALIAVLTQPWTTGYGPTFLAWPSAVTTFLLTFVAYQIVSSHGNPMAGKQGILIGIFICLMIFTRFQIGIATLLLTLVYFFFQRNGKNLIFFLSSLFASISIVIWFLLSLNWFQYFFFDSIEYSLTYIQDEFSVNPTPTFTIITSGITFVFLVVLGRFGLRISNLRESSLSKNLYLIIPFINVLLLLLLLASPDSQEILIRAVRRLWIGGVLGFALFVMVRFILKIRKREIDSPMMVQIWLFLYGGIGMIQLYPLFDQMHFWWGLFPLAIPLSVIFLNSLSSISTSGKRFVFACLISLGVFTVLIPSLQNSFSEREIYSGGLVNLVQVSEKANLDQRALQDFFKRSVSQNSKLLNLCHNADVFFNPQLARSSSRFFIYWPPFVKDSRITHELAMSNPDVVVTCSQSHIALATRATELAQFEILNSIGMNTEPVDQMSLNGTNWKIFRP